VNFILEPSEERDYNLSIPSLPVVLMKDIISKKLWAIFKKLWNFVLNYRKKKDELQKVIIP